MNEWDEIAANMRARGHRFDRMQDAREFVRSQMPSESETLTDNVAESLAKMA